MTMSENMGENKVGVGGIKNFFFIYATQQFMGKVYIND